jgi:hypothetical protein
MAFDGTPFGYRPDNGYAAKRERDKSYPREVSRQRPALATRIHCNENYEDRDPILTVRGDHEPGGREPHDLFNEQLRGGHRLIVDGDGE